MNKDKFGQIVLDERDLVNAYLSVPERTIKHAYMKTVINIDRSLGIENPPEIIQYLESDESINQFDKRLQDNWHMPDEYKNLDIAKWVLDLCTTDEQRQRVGTELLLYLEQDLFPLLQYLLYLVDTMRENNIVWGVGRGSSVSSYVLYLIGIHKIDSLYYDLSIEEFLR